MMGSSLKNYGVIKMENNMQFLIHCCFCDKKFCKMKLFKQHIYDAHMYKIESPQVHSITTKEATVIQEKTISSVDSDFEDIIKEVSDNSMDKPKLKYLEISTLSLITDRMSSTESLSESYNCKEEILTIEKDDTIVENTIKEENPEIFLIINNVQTLQDSEIEIFEDNDNLQKLKMDQKWIETLEKEKSIIQNSNLNFEMDSESYTKIHENKTNEKILRKFPHRNYNLEMEFNTDYEIFQNNKTIEQSVGQLRNNNDNIEIELNSDDEILENNQTNEESAIKVENKDYKFNIVSDDESVENNTIENNVRKIQNENYSPKIGEDSDSDDENLKSFLESLCTDSEEEIFDKVIDNYYCLKCNKVFKKLYNFEKHQQYHNTEYNCKECGVKCSTKKQLRSHLRCHTNIGPFSCKICSKIFRTKSTLSNHNKIHIGNKPFSCDWCGDKRKFFYMREKLIHERTMHTKDYQYQCELCGRGFATQSYLARHKRTHHTTERTFFCKVCKKAFTTHEGVYRHEKIHSSERPFQCDMCPNKFISSSHLKRHIQVHIGVKPFKCDLCEKYFTRKINLNDHLKTVHGKIFDNECITKNLQ